SLAALAERLASLRERATQFFASVEALQQAIEVNDVSQLALTPQLSSERQALRAEIKRLSVDVAGAARGSALIADADLHDLRHNTRRMLASVNFRQYVHSGVHIHHDEDVVLGVDPPSQ